MREFNGKQMEEKSVKMKQFSPHVSYNRLAITKMMSADNTP
jgi:hypothetical protein